MKGREWIKNTTQEKEIVWRWTPQRLNPPERRPIDHWLKRATYNQRGELPWPCWPWQGPLGWEQFFSLSIAWQQVSRPCPLVPLVFYTLLEVTHLSLLMAKFPTCCNWSWLLSPPGIWRCPHPASNRHWAILILLFYPLKKYTLGGFNILGTMLVAGVQQSLSKASKHPILLKCSFLVGGWKRKGENK